MSDSEFTLVASADPAVSPTLANFRAAVNGIQIVAQGGAVDLGQRVEFTVAAEGMITGDDNLAQFIPWIKNGAAIWAARFPGSWLQRSLWLGRPPDGAGRSVNGGDKWSAPPLWFT